MNEQYYREKICNLIENLFIDTRDAKSRIISAEDKIFAAMLASSAQEVPDEIKKRWTGIWNELHQEIDYRNSAGEIVMPSIKRTLYNKQNRSMEKYLLFFLEEFFRIL